VRCQDTPFDNIESALEYVSYLLEACQEAQGQVDDEIVLASEPPLERRKAAFQMVSYKLNRLSLHVAKCQHLLKDLRRLRRIILEEHRALAKSTAA